MFKNYSYRELSQVNIEKVLKDLNVKPNDGFTFEEADRIRMESGDNHIDYVQTKSKWELFKDSYFTPFNLILVALSAITFVTDYVLASGDEKDLLSAVIIFILVLLSGTMTFIQNLQSKRSIENLESMVQVTSAVKREGRFQEIPTEDIIDGDIVQVKAGDMIPADMRLLDANDLFVSQTALTGESYPVEKRKESQLETVESPTDIENILFTGTEVISGSATGVVVKTGSYTMFGDLAQNIQEDDSQTSFDEGIEKTSKLLIHFMLLMALIVILINGLLKGDWLQALLFGISIAVGLTPEMLPMIVSTNLIKGANDLSKEGAITRHLSAVQNFGAIDVLVTDKTGTLTEDSIVLQHHLDYQGEENERVLKYGFLNAYYQTGLGNVMDQAIVDAGKERLNDEVYHYQKIDEIPYDYQRRRLSVVVKNSEGQSVLVTKGALEEMLDISISLDLGNGQLENLDDGLKEQVLKQARDLNEQGLRVLGLAQKPVTGHPDDWSIEDESEMIFMGYLAFLDPPKESTRIALKGLSQQGVGIKVMTGDNEAVTLTVAKQVGIDCDQVVQGSDLEGKTDEELTQLVREHQLFVKVTPNQKSKLVQLLKESGQVVGYLGDGINDSPALREADVGISVDNAVDIAKEASDLIIVEKDLTLLEKGTRIGRKILANTMKYIKATISSNFGNVFSVLVASLFLPFLPMSPTQLLLLGLIYEISSMSIPFDHVDAEYLKRPKKWETDSIRRFMLYFGPTSSIFDVITYLYGYFYLAPTLAGGAYASLDPQQQAVFIAVFQTAWFVVSLWTQTLVIFTLRTPKLPFIESRPSATVLVVTSLGLLLGTTIPYTGFGQAMGLVALPGSFYVYLLFVCLAYLFLVQIMKKNYVKKHGELL